MMSVVRYSFLYFIGFVLLIQLFAVFKIQNNNQKILADYPRSSSYHVDYSKKLIDNHDAYSAKKESLFLGQMIQHNLADGDFAELKQSEFNLNNLVGFYDNLYEQQRFNSNVLRKYDGYRDYYYLQARVEYQLLNVNESRRLLNKALEFDPQYNVSKMVLSDFK